MRHQHNNIMKDHVSIFFLDVVDHIVVGTVIHEPRASNIAREVCFHGDHVLIMVYGHDRRC